MRSRRKKMSLINLGKPSMNNNFVKFVTLLSTLLVSMALHANELKKIDFTVLAGEQVELRLTMSEPPQMPRDFATDNPARIALDFEGTSVKLENRTMFVGTGSTRSVAAVEAQGKTRVVINLVQSVPYTARIDDNDYVITIGKSPEAGSGQQVADNYETQSQSDNGVVKEETAHTYEEEQPNMSAPNTPASNIKGVSKVHFSRGETGEGRVEIHLTDLSFGIDAVQEGSSILIDVVGADVDENYIRKLDVVDFATPVKTIDTKRVGDNVRVRVDTTEKEFEFFTVQLDNVLVAQFKPLTDEEVEQKRLSQPEYTGQPMTISLQDSPLRAVLSFIARYAGFNLVTTDAIAGKVTLELNNVPWDQALDIILKSKGLDKRINGNVIMIDEASALAQREAMELQAQAQTEQLAPLRSEFVQVNYAKAEDLAEIIQGEKTSLLSDRGSVTVDQRTNTLLVRDTVRKIADIRRTVLELDIPVRQVLIESRIVVADDGVGETIGVRFGINDQTGSDTISGTSAISRLYQGLLTKEDDDILYDELFNTAFPASQIPGTAGAGGGSIGFTIGSLSSEIILDVELSALESENKSEVIASPKVTTANQKKARIEAGEEIPYEQSTSSGATSITFKKAVLALDVTPQITPNDKIILDLQVSQDSRGEDTVFGPAIDTRSVNTQVFVQNGETIVLGGIYQQRQNKSVTKVPLLGDLPGIGFLFRRTEESEGKSELLIFVTPKIIKDKVR